MKRREDDSLWDLETLAEAHQLGDWMFAQFSQYASGRVAEVGAGIGTFSRRLRDSNVADLLLVEPEAACAAQLKSHFADDPAVTVAQETLPGAPSLVARGGSLDFVLCQNVLEHIADDAGAVAAMANALKPGGVLSILVPAHPAIFGELDRTYGHVRRYTRGRLLWLAGWAQLEPILLYHFNALGIAGWVAKNAASRVPRLDPASLRMYERLVRIWRPFEERLRPPIGLSLVLHARRV